MTDFSVDGQRVVVVGAGRSGIAAAELLASRGARVVLSDSRLDAFVPERIAAAGIDLELGEPRETIFEATDLVVLSPGVPVTSPFVQSARRRGIPVVGELELASRWLVGRLVAVTGTKGKSTTVTLAGRMLEAAGRRVEVGGNIGVALSVQVGRSTPDVVHVVEVSSFQLETVDTFHPEIAVLLNLATDHLDRHGTIEGYAAAKSRIFENQVASDWAVVNADDPGVLRMATRGRARQLRFACESTLDEGIVLSGDAIAHRTAARETPLIPLSAVRVPGRHLLSDVLAAAAIGVLVGVSAEHMTRAVESFSGLEHALEDAGEVEGVRFVNDSKATNVVAAQRAIECFERDLVVILGGRHKGGELASLQEPLVQRAVAVVAIGEARPTIVEALSGELPIYEADTLAQAVRVAHGLAPPRGTVLLAPACASFDMFKDYAERGRAFKAEVAALDRERSVAREQ